MEQNTQIKTIISSVVIAMVLVIMVVISALIVATITSNSVFTDTPITGTVTNETLVNVTNLTSAVFAIKTTYSTSTCTLTEVSNATGGEVLLAANYTFTGSDCSLILVSGSEYIEFDLNTTYDYSHTSGTSLAGVNITYVSQSFGNYVTNLIAFLAIIGTILGVIWLVLYVRHLFDKKEGLNGITA